MSTRITNGPNRRFFSVGVDAIGNNSQCYNCGGWRLASRECPSDRRAKGGKAKREVKGLDKGVGKGGKGGGDGGTEGKGRGYQGTCYTCRKVGHKAWVCVERNVNAVRKRARERWRRWWPLERSETRSRWRLSM